MSAFERSNYQLKYVGIDGGRVAHINRFCEIFCGHSRDVCERSALGELGSRIKVHKAKGKVCWDCVPRYTCAVTRLTNTGTVQPKQLA